ncbi:MAG: hypothetical protein HQL61_10265 [Magnetococcales bacterium]|nr:hypothetical protein [Nitrospirota bacterium]
MKWFYAEKLRSFRNEIQIAWPLKRTIVSVAIVTLMFVTGISTTASIHQLIWIANAPTRFGIIHDSPYDSFVERSMTWTTSERFDERIAMRVVSYYLQDFLDSYIAGKPYRIVKDSDGTEGCIEASNAKASNASTMGTTCRVVYHEAASATYTAFPDGINEVLNDFINHANNMGNHLGEQDSTLRWFSWQSWFVAKHTREGEIVLATVNSHAVSVTVYAESFNVPIFSTVVTARKQKDENNITHRRNY